MHSPGTAGSQSGAGLSRQYPTGSLGGGGRPIRGAGAYRWMEVHEPVGGGA
jgi:hypothetical protein